MSQKHLYDRTCQPTASRRAAGRDGVAALVAPPVKSAATRVAPAALGKPAGGGLPESRFRDLVCEWKKATLFTSSITEIATRPAYQQIIGMGKAALPLIFAELRREPDHWFWALKAITGDDPVPPAARGDMERMAQAWLVWAKNRGY